MKKQILISLIAFMFTVSMTNAASNYSYQVDDYASIPQGTLKGSVIHVPSGMAFEARTTRALSSATMNLGEGVSMVLGSDFYYNNSLVAPKGSYLTGTVSEVSKAKHGSMNGKLLITFTNLTTPYGVQIPITGVIKTSDGTGRLIGGTKADVTKAYAKDLVVGSAAGALSGVVFGALAGGNIARGAALGTAVGAGGGLVKAGVDKGNDVEIPAGANIDILLKQPITVNPSSYSYNY